MGVGNMVRYFMPVTVEDDAFVSYGLVHAVGRIMGVFYSDDGLIGSWEP